jgi:hypothetical protein
MIPLPSSVKQTVRRKAERTLHRICYPHVPKCAGMSVARGISRQAFSMLERRLFPTFSVDPRASLRAAEATSGRMMEVREEILAYGLASGRFRFVTGHVPCRPGLVEAFQGEWHFVTVLRDPVERWVSEYVYNTEKGSDWARNHLSIEDYLGSPEARVTATSFLRYFSDIPEDLPEDPGAFVDQAVENLSRFAVVGCVEDMDGFNRAFRNRFGAILSIPRRNVTPDRSMKDRIRGDAASMDRIRQLCAGDSEIYRRALADSGAQGGDAAT